MPTFLNKLNSGLRTSRPGAGPSISFQRHRNSRREPFAPEVRSANATAVTATQEPEKLSWNAPRHSVPTLENTSRDNTAYTDPPNMSNTENYANGQQEDGDSTSNPNLGHGDGGSTQQDTEAFQHHDRERRRSEEKEKTQHLRDVQQELAMENTRQDKELKILEAQLKMAKEEVEWYRRWLSGS